MPKGTLNTLLDAREVMERALDSERGVELTFTTHGELVNFRQRCYTLRRLEQEHTRKVYDVGHPGYGTSLFDRLILKEVKGGAPVLKVLKTEGILPDSITEIKEL